MKLRNKKTGEIIIPTDYTFASYDDGIRYGHHIYYSLAELNEEWEDYKPKEPKLEGEVREIVRHWANLHGYTYVKVGFIEKATQMVFCVESPDTRKCIEFLGAYVADDFETGFYNIDQLCGEDEEC